MPPKSSLGRGLGSLLPDIIKDIDQQTPYLLVGIEELRPNRYQARKDFPDEEQRELVDSIRSKGILQPVVVRKVEQGYEIIAGERRWRAAQAAGLKNIPVIIREATDLELAQLSLIENIQRESLNPIEECHAYHTLTTTFGLSQEELARQVGKDRSTIANTMRLIKLPEDVKKAIIDKKISAGHARTILALDTAKEQSEALKLILKKGLNVRETELLLTKRARTSRAQKKSDPYLKDMENELSRRLMTHVQIKQGTKSGHIKIRYSSLEELNRIVSLLF